MLQWMGGSRRKLITSRKSTHQRQKQYFEQRRRQLQRQGKTTGLESYADGINISGQHHKENRSLDILSLLDLSTTAQEHKSTFPKRDKSGFQVEIAFPKKVALVAPDIHNKCFNEVKSKPDNRRTGTEEQYSVLDFLGDDGLNDHVKGSPVHEAHVAFSVEGLGKMGMETPFHSPKHTGRTFLYDCSLPLNAARELKSFKNVKHLEDFEIETDTMMQDINIPFHSSALEFSTDSMDSFCNSRQKLSRTDGQCSKLDSRYGSRTIFDNAESCRKDKWDGRSCFPNEHSFNEWEHDLSWNNWSSEMNRDPVDNLMHGKYKMSDFTLEGPFSPLRSATSITDEFDILEIPSYSKHKISENDRDYMASNRARYRAVGRNFDTGGLTCQPDWSCFMSENERDDLSLLSEESCSSSAVRDNVIHNSLTKSKRRHDNACAGWEYHAKIACTERTQDRSKHVQPESIANGSGKFTKMSNSSTPNAAHYSTSPLQEKHIPNNNWFSEEQYMSANLNSGCSSFLQNSETKCPSTGSKVLFGEPFGGRPVSELNADARSPFKPSEPVASSPPGSFISEKFEFQDSPRTPKVGFGPAKPELRYSAGRTPSPDLSAQESVSKCAGGKAESQLSDKSKEGEEHCLLNNGWFTEDNDAVGDITSKNENSEWKEAKESALELKASVASTYLLDHADKTSKEDHHGYEIPLPCQNRNKEMEGVDSQERKKESELMTEFVDTSCQVMMLQSYVQFLCVQKV